MPYDALLGFFFFEQGAAQKGLDTFHSRAAGTFTLRTIRKTKITIKSLTFPEKTLHKERKKAIGSSAFNDEEGARTTAVILRIGDETT